MKSSSLSPWVPLRARKSVLLQSSRNHKESQNSGAGGGVRKRGSLPISFVLLYPRQDFLKYGLWVMSNIIITTVGPREVKGGTVPSSNPDVVPDGGFSFHSIHRITCPPRNTQHSLPLPVMTSSASVSSKSLDLGLPCTPGYAVLTQLTISPHTDHKVLAELARLTFQTLITWLPAVLAPSKPTSFFQGIFAQATPFT